jgi:hypothetical protein
MEPVISTVLQALLVGAQAVATGIATDEAKRIYNQLKALIQQRWTMKPPAEKLISEYEKDPDSWKQVLAEKLEQSGIYQDQLILQKAKQLLQTINTSTTVDQSRKASSGHTATTGATISQDIMSAGQNAYKVGGNFSQSITYSRRTRLVILLGILTLVLAGIIVYLVRTGKIQLPRISLSPPPPAQTEEFSKPLPDVNTSPSTSNQKVSVENVEIQVRNLARNGENPDFVGVATNVGKTEIAEFFIIAIISKMTIRPGDLSGSKLVTVIDSVRNLKPGETRKIGGYFNLEDAWIEEFPKKYRDKNFNYGVNWRYSYKWSIRVADKDDVIVCAKDRGCAQKYL